MADDNFILTWSPDKATVGNLMTRKLILITKWLKELGLKVNESKTEMFLFHREDIHPIELIVNNTNVKSMQSMHVLGVSYSIQN